MKKQCPNIECKSSYFIKDGVFRRRSDCRVIQRFRCRSCGKRFSNASFSLAKNHNKRQINYTVFKLFGSGVSMRRIAKIVGVDKKTIQRKVHYLDKMSQSYIDNFLEMKKGSVSNVQFDDLITIEHTKLKPVSVSIAVDKHTREILGAKAVQIPAFGHLAALSRKKYGKRKCHHKMGLEHLFKQLAPCLTQESVLESDEHRFYPIFVKRHCPAATIHQRYKGGRGCVVGQGELKKLRRDPLFAINHTCAMLRDNLKRLARKTWCTTKSVEMLQKHLSIYIWYHNTELLTG